MTLTLPRYQPLPPLKEDPPLVSVVLFCRNRAYCLPKAVHSLLAQSYPHWELIIQDGASTDGSRELLQQFTDPRIKLVSEPDGGPFDAMWRALKRCQGEIIGFCLSDEELLPLALAEGVDYFRRHPETAALSRDLFYTDLTGAHRTRVDSREFNFHDYLGQQSKMSLVTVLFRRLALQELSSGGRVWRKDCADFELLSRLGARFRFDYFPGPSALFAQGHAGQLSTTPEVGFFCTQGHLQFIDEFYHESPDRTRLRNLALQNAFEPVKKLYQAKGPSELEKRLDSFYASFAVRETTFSLELVDQSIRLGLLDLALGFLQSTPPSREHYDDWLRLSLEIFEQFWQQEVSLDKWEDLARSGYPGAEERWLRNRLRVGAPDPRQILDKQTRWGARQIRTAPQLPWFPGTASRTKKRKVAFHSWNWFSVEARHQIQPFLPYLAADEIEVVAYQSSPDAPPDWPANIPLTSLPPENARHFIQQIRTDQVDILIEISPLWTGNGLPWTALAARCAPVQISYLGHPSTTGLATIDYLLADHHSCPWTAHGGYTEKILHLPTIYTCFMSSPRPPSQTPPKDRLDRCLTFGCWATSSFLHQTVLDLWVQILQRCPGHRLLLANVELNSCDCRSFLRSYFSAQGIPTENIQVVPRLDAEIPWDLTDQIDVYLDTFPHSDAEGVALALSRGIPAVSLEGATMASRLGASWLRAAGFDQGVAVDQASYVEKALQLIASTPDVPPWKTVLPQRLQEAGATDARRFAARLRELLLNLPIP